MFDCDTLCTSDLTDNVMFSYRGTDGRTGTALCRFAIRVAGPVGVAADRARSAAAHWLGGRACSELHTGGEVCYL